MWPCLCRVYLDKKNNPRPHGRGCSAGQSQPHFLGRLGGPGPRALRVDLEGCSKAPLPPRPHWALLLGVKAREGAEERGRELGAGH